MLSIPPEEQSQSTEFLARETENKLLKIGYADTMHRRWPFNEDPASCPNEESAYILSVEQQYMEIPKDLWLQNILDDIEKRHHERLEGIWHKIIRHQRTLTFTKDTLDHHWRKIPSFIRDGDANRLMQKSPINIRKCYSNTVRKVISSQEAVSTKRGKNRLTRWQIKEKSLRRSFFEAHKNFMASLRIYYEMLLEKSDDNNDENTGYVLPKDHPKRQEIVVRTRYLKLLDATHQAIAVAKAAHHEQGKKRLRKTAEIPYFYHVLDVTNASVADVVPHIIEETKLAIDIVLLGIISAIHDLLEDTSLTLDGLDSFLKRLVDKYDSSIDQLIGSAFGKKPGEVKGQVLDLLKDRTQKDIRQIMRVLSNNTALDDGEKKKAVQQNIAGIKKTMEALGITDRDHRKWQIDTSTLPEPAKTYQKFPENYDGGKLTGFLVRLTTLASGKRIQQALITKCEDRANNILALQGLTPQRQLSQLRSTTTRLIAYAVLDHNLEQWPLFNALPRLIDNTYTAYQKFAREHSNLLESYDSEYLKQLQRWRNEVKRYPKTNF